MKRVTYNECLHNHSANLGRYMVDGCTEYSPRNTDADLLCAACGCHRNYHRKVTIFEPDVTEASGNYSPADDNNVAPSSPADDNNVAPRDESFNHDEELAMLKAGGEYEKLNQLVESAQQRKKKRPKSKFSKEQIENMRAFAEKLGWSTRDRSRVPEISMFCAEMGIRKVVFTTWLYNNKKHYCGGSSSKKDCSSTRDQTEV